MTDQSPSNPDPQLPASMAAAIARTVGLDARGPSAEAVHRALDLARLMPRRAGPVWREWFDRAAEWIGTPLAPATALAGIRRASAPQLMVWRCPVARVEVEFEQRVGPDGTVTMILQGHVDGTADMSRHACPVAALAVDGRMLACTVVERGGYFALEAPDVVGHLALALPGGTLILDRIAAGSSDAAGATVQEE